MNNTPPKLLKKWRKEFEQHHYIPTFIIWKDDSYIHNTLNSESDISNALNEQLNTWILSRQTAVIELPSNYSTDYALIDKIKARIESQGYRVAPDGREAHRFTSSYAKDGFLYYVCQCGFEAKVLFDCDISAANRAKEEHLKHYRVDGNCDD